MSSIRVVNWNVGGAKFLRLNGEERDRFQSTIASDLETLCSKWKPDVVSLQEVTRFRRPEREVEDLIQAPPGYCYSMASIHDTEKHSHPVRWQRYRDAGGWNEDDYIAQGAGFLWREGLRHGSIWERENLTPGEGLICELVPVETGLFTGDRDTEPRAAVVSHFALDNEEGSPVDVYVLNLHLSTLHGERESGGRVDALGSEVRRRQLNVVLHGVVSRHAVWSSLLEERRPRPSLWVLAGDFNAPPESLEIGDVISGGFQDANPHKGKGNKTAGLGKDPTHTVDYVFANYLDGWDAVRDRFDEMTRENPTPDLDLRTSDHYPTIASIPLPS